MKAQDKLKIIRSAENAAETFIKSKKLPMQDVMGDFMAKYWYFKNIESYVKKEKEKAIKNLTSNMDVEDAISVLVRDTEKMNEGQFGPVAKSSTFQLTCKTKKGARRFDVAKLTSALMVEHRMSAKKVEALIESCYDVGNPSKEFDVEEI